MVTEFVALATEVKKISRVKDIKHKQKTIKDYIRDKKTSVYSGDRVIAIACSTGGPRALHMIIRKIPQDIDASIIVVQHMPRGFTKSLSERLNEISKVHVKEAEHGEILEKGTVYIAKGGYQMRVMDGEIGQYHLVVTEEPPRNSLSPCADIMYESLIDTRIDKITCVVLTGMGRDGTEGISKLSKEKDVYVIAQDKESSVVYGMPGSIKEAGLVDEEVPLSGVADAIINSMGCDKWT